MVVLVALHALAACLAPLLTRFLGRRVFAVLALVPAAAFIALLSQTSRVADGQEIVEELAWAPSINLELTFRLSSLQWLLALLVTGVGAVVLLYCTWYFRAGDPGLWRFASVFTFFAGSMLGLVLADDLLLMFTFWELTSVSSYLLVGHNPVRSVNRRAAMQALLVTVTGGLAMLAGIVMIGEQSSYRISEILLDPPPPSGTTTAAVLLILIGALTKSAQVPFHFWLPGAMAAPTPVSAYLHAAAMVKAGVYLIALFAPVFAQTPGWRPITIGLGAFTMLLGGWRALRQNDIKLLLAFGTVSQLGLLTVFAAFGTKEAALAGLALVLAHATFKSALFLTVGVIDRSTGTRDLTELSGIGRTMPVLAGAAAVAGMSMAGVIPALGFVAKEAALESLRHAPGGALPGWLSATLLGVVVAGSALTVAYTARFLWGAFATKPHRPPTEFATPHAGFLAAPVVLGGACLVLAPLSGGISRVLDPYVESFGLGPAPAPLAIWHGLSPVLLLTVLSIGIGVLLFIGRQRVERLQSQVPALIDGERLYNAGLRTVDRGAVELTALTQRGSLPFYLSTILLVVILFPGIVALSGLSHVTTRLWDTPGQLGLSVVVVIATVLAARSRNRLQSVLYVGVTSYAVAVLFLLHGAPDLAITQIVVETVALVIFVLVLRRMPASVRQNPHPRNRIWRGVLAAGVGAVVAVIGLVAVSARTATPMSDGFPEAAYERGHGKNVVNVTLVDIRAWDTLGEVSVLVAAATGIASLVFVSTRNAKLRRVREWDSADSTPAAGPSVWLAGGHTLSPRRQSVIFEVITRLIFHLMIALSLYLLFVGHNSPGGGFAGGLVAGAALLVRYLAGGRYELDEAAPVHAGVIVGMGMLTIVVTALAPLLVGGDVLQSALIEFWLPVWSDVKLVTPIFFDIGVYLIVVGLLLDIGRSLGSGVDGQGDPRDDITIRVSA